MGLISTSAPHPTLRFLQTMVAACLFMTCSISSAEIDPRTETALSKAIAEGRLTSWNNLISAGQSLTEEEKLAQVNSFVNRAISYDTDSSIWGANEYWATPAEALIRGQGDCEDYAIAKFFTLTRMGVPGNKLRLSYVKALGRNQAHMVLAYYATPNSEPLLLDNLKPQIKPASQRKDLLPVYAFNNEGIYLATSPQKKSKQSPQLLSRWNDVRERAVADGSATPQNITSDQI